MSGFPRFITLLGLALALLMAVPESQSAEDPRKSAFASWTFDQSGPVEKKNPLLVIGDVEFLELPEEEKKASLARGGTGWFARLQGGHLHAGTHLNLPGAAGTVYLRARDPSGRWRSPSSVCHSVNCDSRRGNRTRLGLASGVTSRG